MSNLAESIDSFPTVKRDNCKDCGNPWWFTRLESFQCTCCGSLVTKPELVEQKEFEAGVVARILDGGVIT